MNETAPFPRSTVIKGIEWLADRLPYPDGVTGWLFYSGSWGSPDDQGTSWRPYYRPNVRKFRFELY